jgi:hypothetical protein
MAVRTLLDVCEEYRAGRMPFETLRSFVAAHTFIEPPPSRDWLDAESKEYGPDSMFHLLMLDIDGVITDEQYEMLYKANTQRTAVA